MISKRLIESVPKSKRYILLSVFMQILSLFANVGFIYVITRSIDEAFNNRGLTDKSISVLIIAVLLTVCIRFLCNIVINRISFLSSRAVKVTLRSKLYSKLINLSYKYNEGFTLSELTQLFTEGIEQLEIYFAAYLPQFFYSMTAPVILFAILFPIHKVTAIVLFAGVPMIPAAIAAVQSIAKKLLSGYWNKYTSLGNSFLDNLQGLTTLKIYNSDEYKNKEMNKKAEEFRKITMRVLGMQLNSIIIMDLIAYGGAALGIFTALLGLKDGNITMAQCFFIILISADFFIPMRQMGSLFHVAMNGVAAGEKMFRILNANVDDESKQKDLPDNKDIIFENLSFSYDGQKEILSHINLSFSIGSYAIVGESGSGKSTIASILSGKHKNYSGSCKIGGIELRDIKTSCLNKALAYIGHESFLFKGSVKENLKTADENADESKMWEVLKRVNLQGFFEGENGLDTMIDERAGNLSGGQRQRLALARALLFDSDIYIFDEATSNIDAESENAIMREARNLAKNKIVIIISHRLFNVIESDRIYLLDNSKIVQTGTHNELLENNGHYADLWETQQSLEEYVG